MGNKDIIVKSGGTEMRNDITINGKLDAVLI